MENSIYLTLDEFDKLESQLVAADRFVDKPEDLGQKLRIYTRYGTSVVFEVTK